jgi:diaminopimelate epimerase
VQALAHRRRGIGFDQLLWLEDPVSTAADVRYRIYNSDGSEAEQCGNGARCIASLVARGRRRVVLEHGGGLSAATIEDDGQVTVDMAVPEFRPEHIPFNAAAPAHRYTIDAGSEELTIGAVSMGNPHAVLVVPDINDAPVAVLGPLLERHERFPNRANIGFMQVIGRDRINLRVFERGAGETQACGTGACAAVVIGHTWGLLGSQVVVQLPGGPLSIRWEGPGTPVRMTGEAVTVCEGTVTV